MKRILTVALVLMLTNLVFAGQEDEPGPLPGIEKKTSRMEKHAGFVPFYIDPESGKIWLEIDEWEKEFLYINSLPAGVGSNDIGLDRGQIGDRRVVKFHRAGPKVFLVQPNYAFRANSDNPAERQSVEQAFAQSILWGFKVAAQNGERALIDATDFYVRDAHGVARALKRSKQGSYKLDESRSALFPQRTKNFPTNTEVEAILTFTGEATGEYVRQVAPSPDAITVHEHASFVQLPDPDYTPRRSDPRAGYWGISYRDYATPISQPLVQRFIARRRLQKKDPTAAVSEAVQPIIYYVDAGAPEPIRSALIEGASWWNEAFTAIGFRNAFQVKVLPEDVDPMDARYNVIQWVHRATRGWSYGDGIVDPRTGEIIKGHVTLGSLRVRQDFLIAQGLLAPYEEGKPVPPVMREMALARLRQLAAHEVGHTLGLIHNFAASVSDRASVMDYPHPFVQLRDDGTLDFSDAYDTGVGAWDKTAIAYGYSEFAPDQDENAALQDIIKRSLDSGLVLISDEDARPAGGAHPLAHLWDNGTDSAKELIRLMEVRKLALSRFSEKNIPLNAPMSSLEEVLAPLYFSLRYQVNAAAKLLGGLYYTYAIRGDGQTVTRIVDPARQRRALKALLATLAPETLAIPERILKLLPPRAFGTTRDRETFKSRTSVTFDPIAAAETAAEQTVGFLLHPTRAARLVEYHSRDPRNPGLGETLNQLLAATWFFDHGAGYHAEIRRVVDNVVLAHLLQMIANEENATQVRALASLKLDELQAWTKKHARKEKDEAQQAHLLFASRQIELAREHPGMAHVTKALPPPDGSPIGMAFYCDWQR